MSNEQKKLTYKEYLQSSLWAKVSLGLLAVMAVIAIYIICKIGKFTGASVLLGGFVALVIIGGVLWLCHRKLPKVATIVTGILVIVLCVLLGPLTDITGAVGGVTQTVEYETVQIVALRDSGITADSAFDSLVMGYVNDDEGAYSRSAEMLVDHNKEVKKSKPYESTEKLYDEFMSGATQLMVLTSQTKSDLSVIDEDFDGKIVVIFEKEFELGTIETKAVDITSEPFTLYLCGTDLSSGSNINSTGRGDVNILLTVNPQTKQVYMQTIPRDTFVYVPCRGGSSKLSYSGWWGGVQSSIESIEDKFDIEINYYAKINFTGLIDLVDALGGVTVYSHYTYSFKGINAGTGEYGEYYFTKGYNEVNGEQALMFARLRKMLPQNELSRGQHQMELIKGIFKKFAENPTYDNGMAVLNSLSNNFVTNLPQEDYYDAFKLVVELLPQLQEMENNSIKGEYQWHYDEVRDGYYQYYYYPEASEIQRVHDSVNAILAGESIE